MTPKATGSCFQMIVMPMAASIPLMTADGTSGAEAARSQHAKQELQDAGEDHGGEERRDPAELRPRRARWTVRPAAGPVTDSGERLIRGTTRPPTTPATSPDTGGTPHAMAMPRHSGSATRKTTMPATASSFG